MNRKILLNFILAFSFLYISAQEAESYSTFHCISLYWKPDEASAENECKVKYRVEGETEWQQGMSLWFDPNLHEGLPERSHEYRGSLVDLVPGTNYEIQLELEKLGTTTTLFHETMSEIFRISRTIKLESGEQNEPLNILNGGSKFEGYVLYDASDVDFTIDVKKQYDYCVRINVPYVIIRGLTLKGARQHGVTLGNVSHVVIEECDISGWGSERESGKLKGFGFNLQSAIFSETDNLVSNIIIQRNKLHHPGVDTNSWLEPVSGTHPEGPQGISLKNTTGHNIIRYNEIYSDKNHMYNDGMGNFGNASFSGFPNRDSDIYGNKISHCWDDGIEAEGSGMNVRIWANCIDSVYMVLGLAAQSLGPLYAFRNIANFTQRGPYPFTNYFRGGSLFKIGQQEGKYKFAKGRIVLMHNTSLQPSTPWQTGPSKAGTEQGLLYSNSEKVQDNIMTRNNILHVRGFNYPSLKDYRLNSTNDFDYDLYNGTITAAPGNEANGIFGFPIYSNANAEGVHYLDASSPGYDDGKVIPNFSSKYVGDGPDRGAFEDGLPPIKSGISADWNEWVDAVNSLSTSNNQVLLDEDRNDNLFITYPNPASEKFTVKFLNNTGTTVLSVYNSGGIKIYSEILSVARGDYFAVEISSWTNGVYIVEALSNKGVQTSLLMVH
jgi:hypothetical protein